MMTLPQPEPADQVATCAVNATVLPTAPANTPMELQRRRREFEDALLRLPPPGNGWSWSRQLLGCCSAGIAAGLDDDQIVLEVAAAIPHGKRQVGLAEVGQALAMARAFAGQQSHEPIVDDPFGIAGGCLDCTNN